jgi:hypothetical protein
MKILTPTQAKQLAAEQELITKLININNTERRRAMEDQAEVKRQAVIDGDAA